jgi:sugar phosphate isomerase/epimerase
MESIPIGLQLYSVREDCARDLPGTLAAIARMGYAGVEFAGYHGYSVHELRRMLDDLGLACCGTHIGLETLLGDALPGTIDFNLALGNRFLIVPGLAEERRSSPAAWRDTARVFAGLARQLAPHGLRVGYHNHAIEFQAMEGEVPWDIFFGHTDARVVMQLDTGNAIHGGGDPAAILRRYPGRAVTVHLKEHSAGSSLGGSSPQGIIGQGDTDWPETFALCESIGGTEWYIVEQEDYTAPPLECVERCLQALRRMGK